MAAIEGETIAGLHFREIKGNVPPYARMLRESEQAFGRKNENLRHLRLQGVGSKIHDRRNRQLRVRNLYECPLGRGERISSNGQSNVHSDTANAAEGRCETIYASLVRANWRSLAICGDRAILYKRDH